MNARPIPADTRARQQQASNPSASAWVSANAGSGKTYVLAQRVIRLLLSGTDPARIVCLTFTKAAAAEMSNRVFDTLAGWIVLEDDQLDAAIAELQGAVPAPQERLAARRLFARALETPGGLKIQTIHAFCERLLQLFPFEANIAGHFTVADDDQTRQIMGLARRQILQSARAEPGGRLNEALETIIAHDSDFRFGAAIDDLLAKRHQFSDWVNGCGSLEKALVQLADRLNVGADEQAGDLEAAIPFAGTLDRTAMHDLLPVLSQGSKTDIKLAGRIGQALDVPAGEATGAYLEIFFKVESTGVLTPRSSARMITQKTKPRLPGLEADLAAEIERLIPLVERLRAFRTLACSRALFTLGSAIIERYDRIKSLRGVLDYDDLIVRAGDLLSRSEAAQWVHYKLDMGIDHILVDEAQDTSPRQWEIVRALAQDYFAGDSARLTPRTLFAVGDAKQSIYSFQGADPRWFTAMRRTMGNAARAAGSSWSDITLNLSFRSTHTILQAVEDAFSPAGANVGLVDGQESGIEPHEAIRVGERGRVEVWPVVEPGAIDEPEDWLQPIDHLGAGSPPVQVANRIAQTIRQWLDSHECLAATGDPIEPKDILILVRKRDGFVQAMNRALKAFAVPVAGTDRLSLTAHIAVQDLIALGEVMLLPQDDLNLAALLKSPLCGLSETQLFELAEPRTGALWDRLAEAAAEDLFLGTVFAKLEGWRNRVDYDAPFEFFSHVLSACGGRAAYLGTIGSEVEDILDAFMTQTLAYERTVQAASLQGCIGWLKSSAAEIKREVDSARNEVRIMTVHGAKGLESPIVFLVDSGSAPVHATHRPPILNLGDQPDLSYEPTGPLMWARPMRDATRVQDDAVTRLETAAVEEYRRLLYVAMTRARDRLYVCGHAASRGMHADCWYSILRDPLIAESLPVTDASGTVVAWRRESGDRVATPAVPRQTGRSDEPHRRPEWLDRVVRPEVRPQPLVPSKAGMELGAAADPYAGAGILDATGADTDQTALQRGRLIHRLLETLPDILPTHRNEHLDRYLNHAAGALPERARAAIRGEVAGILQDPEFAPVFAPDGIAEVAVSGSITWTDGQRRPVIGQIDRLCVSADQVLVVDYKTNRLVPELPDGVAREYLVQLEIYRQLIAERFPDHGVRMALLWTSAPKLMEIPNSLLVRQLAPVTGS